MNANSECDQPKNHDDYKKEYNRVHTHYIRDWPRRSTTTYDEVRKKMASNENNGERRVRNLVVAIAPVLRAAMSVVVLLSLLVSALHYSKARWTDDNIADYSKASNLTTNQSLLLYKTPIEYTRLGTSHYDAGTNERHVNLRVRIFGTTESPVDFLGNLGDLGTIDVVDDMLIISWVAFIWFTVLASLSILRGGWQLIKIWADVDPPTNSCVRVTSTVFDFFFAFENADASSRFLTAVGFERDPAKPDADGGRTWLRAILSMILRFVFSIFREGFFVVFSALSVVYAYLTFSAFQGSCYDGAVAGGCSIQQYPADWLRVLLIGSVTAAGRFASSYNYVRDDVDDLVASKKDTNESKYPYLFGVRMTLQLFACIISIACSGVTMWFMHDSFYMIGNDRRFPYVSLYATVIVLEALHMVVNALVVVLPLVFGVLTTCTSDNSEKTAVKAQRQMKMYIEGKIFGALYFFAVSLSIYMSLRLGVNMFGTYWSSPENALEGEFHPRQLSVLEERCHYIPEDVFKSPEKYNFSPCDATDPLRDCCTMTTYDASQSSANGTSAFTGLIVAIVAIVVQVVIVGIGMATNDDNVKPVINQVNKWARSSNRRLGPQPAGFNTIRVV